MAWQPSPVFLPGESPWTEEPGRLQSTGSQRAGHDWATKHSNHETSSNWSESYPWKKAPDPVVVYHIMFLGHKKWWSFLFVNYPRRGKHYLSIFYRQEIQGLRRAKALSLSNLANMPTAWHFQENAQKTQCLKMFLKYLCDKPGLETSGPCFWPHLKCGPGNPLVVQWIGLCAFAAEGSGSIPGQELRFYKTQSKAKIKHGPAAFPESLLDMQTLRDHTRPAELQNVLYRNIQVIWMDIKKWEAEEWSLSDLKFLLKYAKAVLVLSGKKTKQKTNC